VNPVVVNLAEVSSVAVNLVEVSSVAVNLVVGSLVVGSSVGVSRSRIRSGRSSLSRHR
jgi:hypothetical protein